MIDIRSQIIKPALNLEDLRVVASAEGWKLTDLHSLHFFLRRNFKYRRAIKITEQSGSDLTDYQVLIELNSTNFDFSHAQTNGEDIRFADANGNLLDYWIEEWDSVNEKAKVWVKVPSIPANGSTEIWMYYGNSEIEDASDGDAVFEFFDDFNRPDNTIIGKDWEEIGDFAEIKNKEVVFTADGSYHYDDLRHNFTTSGDIIIELKMQNYATGTNRHVSFMHHTNEKGLRIWLWGDDATVRYYYSERIKIGSWTPGVYVSIKLIYHYSSDTYDIWVDGEEKATNVPPESSSFSNKITCGISSQTSGGKIDDIRIRKYASPEPSVSLGAEETA